jgi:outer membrane autotransporter protein
VNWNIVGLPGQAAFEMLKAPEMAQDFWRRSGDAWTAREQEVRDSMWGSTPGTRGEGWEMWAQAQIGGERLSRTENFTVGGFNFTPNLGTDSDWRGFQMGGDNWTSHNWLWGFTGGYLEQNTSFHQDKNSFDMTGWNVGAYAGFTSGHFFANGLVKGDWFNTQANMHTVPAMDTFSGNTWGAKAEAGWRIGGNGLYLEPLADLAWTSTHLDDANFPAQATSFSFGTATSLRGSIGARVGGQWGSILPYVGLYAAQEFDGKNNMTMMTGLGCPTNCMSITDLKPGSYERADFGFTTTSWNGLEGFLKGEAEFGGHTDGFTGRMGVRWRW